MRRPRGVWRGPREEGEFPTLGYQIGAWIEANCIIPDGFRQNQPYGLTDEMLRFLLWFYRLHPDAAVEEGRDSAPFVYRGSQFMRAQKWGKSPFGASVGLASLLGPVVFDGWDARGEPVGRSHPTPWIQVVATSEEQTDNTWLAIYYMAQNGPLADTPGIEVGMGEIRIPGGGRIEPRSSSGKARLGGRITFAIFDESHLMTQSSGGLLLATTMKRNLSGMGGRWMETTNAYDPSEGSVAQRTQESAAQDVYVDYRPPSRRPDLMDDEDALEVLRYVYGDSWWVDHRRILADARDPGTCPTTADAMRYFFNLIEVGVREAADPTIWASRARPRDLARGEAIALGFDGSRSSDCTSLVASRLFDGRWFHLRTWDPAEEPGHRVPRRQVDDVVTAAFKAYRVAFLFLDPFRWEEYADLWESRWPGRVVQFPTNVDRRMDDAIQRFLVAFAGSLTHDGDAILAAHARNAALANGARRAPRPEESQVVTHHYLKVVKKREGHHIDAFVAGLLAEEARGHAIEKGHSRPPKQPRFAWA